jgi:hypothetical protein
MRLVQNVSFAFQCHSKVSLRHGGDDVIDDHFDLWFEGKVTDLGSMLNIILKKHFL